jgi:hypothetical protein
MARLAKETVTCSAIRWQNNDNKINLRQAGCEGLVWIKLRQVRLSFGKRYNEHHGSTVSQLT